MPAKKKTTTARPKQTPKRKTAIPATRVRASLEPTRMRLAEPPVEKVTPTHDMIAARAYQLWETKTKDANDSMKNWLDAEAQLRKELNGIRF